MVTQAKKKVDPKLRKLRRRESYQMFLRLVFFLQQEPSIPDVIKRIDDEINAHNGYGSMAASGYANESMQQVLDDLADKQLEEPSCKAGLLFWRTYSCTDGNVPTPAETCQDCQYLPANVTESGQEACRPLGRP